VEYQNDPWALLVEFSGNNRKKTDGFLFKKKKEKKERNK
jgi:hypothetical protein